MQKILISACLMGEDVTYDQRSNFVDSKIIQKWKKEGRIVPVCPEVSGGLPTPRPAAYIIGPGGGKAVFNNAARVTHTDGTDVTDPFIKGAERALALVKKHDIKVAIMKERSPSCGSHEIYADSFDGKTRRGDGVTAALLKKHGVTIFPETELEKADAFLRKLESGKKHLPKRKP